MTIDLPETGDDETARSFETSSYFQLKAAQYNFQKWLLDDEPELERLYSTLSGTVLVESNGELISHNIGSGLMNKTGALKIVYNYLYLISKSGKLSNFNEKQIEHLLFQNMSAIDDHLLLNQEYYELQERDHAFVLTLIETFLICIFNRSLRGAEQERIGNTQKNVFEERYTGSVQPQQQQPSESKARNVVGFVK